MPSRVRVSEFVSCVQAGNYVEAIRDFYAETARMKENHGEPRVGRENLIRHEQAVLAGLRRMGTQSVGPGPVYWGFFTINLGFEIKTRDWKKRRSDAISLRKNKGG